MDDFEKKECLKILDLLTTDNLLSLTDTVTGRVVTVENKEEAVNAIMLYTRNGEELLRRRKVRRENLYQYLAQQGYLEHPAADKNTLLRKVLKLWELKKQGKDLKDLGDTGFSFFSRTQPAELVPVIQVNFPPVTPIILVEKDHSSVAKNLKDYGDIGFSATQPAELVTQVDFPVAETPIIMVEKDNYSVAVCEDDSAAANITAVETPVEKNESQQLAYQFASWFFKLLESIANCTAGTNPVDWGPQHFWRDAKLTVQCNEPTGMQETTVEGARLVSDKFQSMVAVDQLCFNPNKSQDSIKVRQDPHGLVLIMVFGTVHRKTDYLGVFEQSFGLIRDPTEENNWKIKFSKLLLKASASGSDNQVGGPDSQLEGPINQLEGPV